MNELQVFNNPEFGEIRTITENGKTLFCGIDVAKALGYSQPHKAVNRHCRYGTKRTVPHPQSPNKTIEMLFIPEGDIYRLAARSTLPGAEKFESWIFDEVLPSIQQHGMYMTPTAMEQMAAGFEALSNTVQSLAQRIDALEQKSKRTSLQVVADGDNPFENTPVVMKPNINRIRRQWMRTASEKLKMLEDKCSLPGTTILHNLYQELEEEYGISLSEVRLKTIEEHHLTDCSVLTAIFYNKPLRKWFEARVDDYLTKINPFW